MLRSARCLFAFLVPALVPDLVPPGVKPIYVVTRVELGALADKVCTAHTVRSGETMVAIARDHLGDERRAGEIAALNPEVEPTKMKVGAVLWLPPKDGKALDPKTTDPKTTDPKATDPKAPNAKPAEAPFLVISRPPIDVRCVPLDPAVELPFSRYGSYVLALVPKDKLADALQGDPKKAADFLGGEATVRIPAATVGRYVDKESPVERAEVTLKVVADKDGKWRIERKVSWFDRDDKRVEADEEGNSKVVPPKKAELWLLLLLAGGAALWLFVGRRRDPCLAIA